jgi:hypothetical protein
MLIFVVLAAAAILASLRAVLARTGPAETEVLPMAGNKAG